MSMYASSCATESILGMHWEEILVGREEERCAGRWFQVMGPSEVLFRG